MRYFYSCEAQAAIMAIYHNMKFESKYGSPLIYDGKFRDTCCLHGEYGGECFYVAPDSLHLLEPQQGDMVLDEDGINGINIELPMQVEQCKNSRIIMRGDLAFMMPECEEVCK